MTPAGPLFAAATLLGVAGVVKLARPHTVVGVLRTARLPANDLTGRALGLAETAVAAFALVAGGALPAALVALSYAGFAAFSALALRRDGTGASCGCFGATDNPLTVLHVAANVGAALLVAAAVLDPVPGVADVVAAQPLAGLPFLALTALCAWLAYATLTLLPALGRAAAGPAARLEPAR
ncbi:hypothetical protein BH24ACT3_BH24ACT3_09740 [soil metagenome]